MTKIQTPLSVPPKMRREFEKNYRLLTGGSANLLLIAGDQKVEHLNADFFGPGIAPEDAHPEHLFQIAAAIPRGVLATQLGLISRYGQSYRQLPYIVKINSKTNLGPNDEKNTSSSLWTIQQVMDFKRQSGLKIAGIGYTVYIGGRYEPQILAEAARIIFEAHQAGLVAVLWMYPRGQGVKEEDMKIISGGAGVAACLDADFVKIKYPFALKNRIKAAESFRQAVAAAGRTKVICVGGEKRPVKELLELTEQQLRLAGANGVAIGRNLHQRSLPEAARLGHALEDILFRGLNAKDAWANYRRPTAKSPRKKTGRFLGLF